MFIRSAALFVAIYGHGALAATISEQSCELGEGSGCSNCVNPLTSSYQPESVANLYASACCTARECDADGTNCDTKKFCYIYSMVSGANSLWASNLPSGAGGLHEETCTTGQLRQGSPAQLAWSLEGQCTTTNTASWLSTATDLEWNGNEKPALSPPGCPAPWESGADYDEGVMVSDAKGVVWTCNTGQAAHCSVNAPTLGSLGGDTYWTATNSCTGTLTPTISPTFIGGTNSLAGCPEAYASGTTYEAGDQVSITRADGTQVVYQCKAFPHSDFCKDPAYEPGVNTGTFYEGEYLWQAAWTYVSGCSGTLTPTASPDFTGAPPTDGCPEAYVDGTEYEAGDKVSIPSAMGASKNFDKIFKCKTYPFSQYCSKAHYKPGTTYNGETLWKDAWTYEGGCTGTISPTISPTFIGGTNSLDGCAEEFVPGTEYEQGDKVAILNVAGANGAFGKVYECKSYPFSKRCGQAGYEPGTEAGQEAWKYDGGCTGTLTPTISPTFFKPAETVGCHEVYVSGDEYEEGDEVSVLNVAGEDGDYGKTYRCKPWPYSGYCGVAGFEPGTENGKKGWTYVSGCIGTLTPTASPMFNAANVYNEDEDGCPEEWTPGNSDYHVGSLVTVSKGTARGMVHRCRSLAVEPWCRSAAYEPGMVNGATAWELVGNCVGTIAPTPSPMAINMALEANACQFKKTLSKTDSSVYVVMTAAAWVEGGGSAVAHGGNVGAKFYTPSDIVREGLTAKKCSGYPFTDYCPQYSPFTSSPTYQSLLSNQGWLDATCENVASKDAAGDPETAFDDDEYVPAAGAPIFSSSGDMVVENVLVGTTPTAFCVNKAINPADFFEATPDVKGCQQCYSSTDPTTNTYTGGVMNGDPALIDSGLGFPGTAKNGDESVTYDSNTCTPCLPLTTSALTDTVPKKSVCSCTNGATDPWRADGKQCQQCIDGKRFLGALVYDAALATPVCEVCPAAQPYFYTKTAGDGKKYKVCCNTANCSEVVDGSNTAKCYAPTAGGTGICVTAFAASSPITASADSSPSLSSPQPSASLSPSESESPSNAPSAFPSDSSTPTATCGATTSVWSQLGSDINGENSHDGSGNAVALSADGKIIAIGAPNNDADTNNFHASSGHVRVYEINESSQWVQLGGDIDGVNAGDRVGGSESNTAVSLSADGMRVAVGSHIHGGNGDLAGHVRVFEYVASSGWTPVGSDIYGPGCGWKLGFAVSLSADGNRVAVGIRHGEVFESGKVRVYEFSASSQWVQLGEDMNGVAYGDSLGYSVALSDDGNIVAAGAPFSDANGANSGEVRVFQYTTALGWTQLGQDIYGTTSLDRSGWAVALSSDGKTLAIGEMMGNADNSGRVRVFEYASSTWEQLGGDIDGEDPNDWTGFAVALSDNGKRVATGAPNANGANKGQVRVFEYCASEGWTQLGLDINGLHAEQIGQAVALSADGEIVAAGAPQGVDPTGRTRVYKLSSS